MPSHRPFLKAWSAPVALVTGGAICLLVAACGRISDTPEGQQPSADPVPDVGMPNPALAHVVAEPSPTPAPTAAPFTPTPTPSPTPLPKTFIPWQKLDLAEVWNGFDLRTKFTTSEGELASRERRKPESFRIELEMHVEVPRASETLDELAEVNPRLPEVLPGLSALMKTARVSDYYHGLYHNKTRYMQSQLTRMDRILSRHNFYDTETILELRHADTGRKVLLMQSEMDVNGDGSDGDRLLKVDQTSSTYQPWTSYRWRKRTDHPNEFLAGREEALEQARARYAIPGLSDKENAELVERIKRLELEIADLKTWSFLLSRADPFIVVPGFMQRDASHPFGPSLGDYAVVIHGATIYPAIVGDVGPSHKNGEASLRICREIDPESGVYRRPESDLVVTYLIFPDTADEPFAPPDLAKWQARVAALLDEIGGHAGTLHEWEDVTMPPPTPTPPPTPAPTPKPGEVPAPAPGATPAGEGTPEPPHPLPCAAPEAPGHILPVTATPAPASYTPPASQP